LASWAILLGWQALNRPNSSSARAARHYLYSVKRSLLFVLCVAWLAGCSSKSTTDMPAIDDPALLAMDCQRLSADTTVHAIAKDQWPDSIKKLNPASVTREENGIFITIATEAGAGSRGYVVAIFKPGDNAHYTITDTPYSKIYRFEFKP